MFMHLWHIYSKSKVIDFDKYLVKQEKTYEVKSELAYIPYTIPHIK